MGKDSFEGKNCAVFGASTGIGFGAALGFLNRGARKVYICSRNERRIQEAAEKLKGFSGRVEYLQVDATDHDQVAAFLKEAASKAPLDIVFNSVGVAAFMPYEEVTLELWERVIKTNLISAIYITHEAIHIMEQQGYGQIVNVSSIAGLIAPAYQSLYCTTKYAMVGMSESLRNEFRHKNIVFSVVCPHNVETPIFGKDPGTGEVSGDYVVPEDAIGVDEAVEEIFEGMEEKKGIIPVGIIAKKQWHLAKEHPEKWQDIQDRIELDRRKAFISQNRIKQ